MASNSRKEKLRRLVKESEKGETIWFKGFVGTKISSEILKVLGLQCSIWDIIFKQYAILPFGPTSSTSLQTIKYQHPNWITVFELDGNSYILIELI